MKKLIYTALLAGIYIVSSSSSCNKHDHHTTNPCEGVMCTAMFAMINTKVVDANGKVVILDNAYTQRVSNKEIYSANQPMLQYDSSYVVLDDSYLTKLQNQTDTFYFIGTKGGKQVVNEPFVINADCCHVNKLSGKSVVTAK